MAYLPNISVEGNSDPVIEVVDEKSGETVYCVRIKGEQFKPKIFKQDTYSIILRDTGKDIEKVIKGIVPTSDPDRTMVVKF